MKTLLIPTSFRKYCFYFDVINNINSQIKSIIIFSIVPQNYALLLLMFLVLVSDELTCTHIF